MADIKTKLITFSLGFHLDLFAIFFFSFLDIIKLFKVVGTAKNNSVDNTSLRFIGHNHKSKAFCEGLILQPDENSFLIESAK